MATEYLNNKSFEKNILRFQKAKKDKLKYEIIIEEIEQRDKFERTLHEEYVNLYKNAQLEFEDCQELLAGAFYTLSENIARYTKFNLIDLDDAIQEGVLICFEKIDRFNPKKGKAFNFLTTTILNSTRQMYRCTKNYNELKNKYEIHLKNIGKLFQ